MIGLCLLLAQADPAVRMDELLRSPALRGGSVGVHVSTLEGVPLYTRNDARRLIPASNQKLLTAALAFDRLNLEQRPVTRIWRDSNRIVVDAPGNPTVSHADLKAVTARLGLSGSDPVRVRQAFAPGYVPGWDWDDLPNRYAAPVFAFTVDRGGFELWVERGRPVFRPRAYGTQIRRVRRSARGYNPFARVVTLGPVSGTKLLDTYSLARPDQAAASILGEWAGEIEDVPSREPDDQIVGLPYGETLRRCLVRSDNQFAEQFLLIATAADGTQPTYANARAALSKFLTEKVGVDPDDVRPWDGSGLARANRVTPRALAQILRYEAAGPNFERWRRSLVFPGAGTLEGRLSGVPFRGKTGTLTGVVALSGYVTTDEGRTVVVSLIANHATGSSGAVRAVLDSMVRVSRRFRYPAATTSSAWPSRRTPSGMAVRSSRL